MGILSWIIFGAIAGWLATKLAGRNENQGCLFNTLLGVVGAIIGGFVFEYFGGSGVTGFNFYSLLVACVGAMILLFVANLLKGNKK